jgi:uncharacterized repeat protein (TIGR03803 family)
VATITEGAARATWPIRRQHADVAALAAGVVVLIASIASGQPIYQPLQPFGAARDAGAKPFDELLQARDGSFYGTTLDGGKFGHGTVFKLDTARRPTTIHSFTGGDGAMPRAGLVEGRDGQFYGTTFFGGPLDAGTLYRITAAGKLTTLHRFAGADGALPSAALVQARDGNFYGTTTRGGAFDAGTVFMLEPSGRVTTIHTFDDRDGSAPFGRLLETRDGLFYGTTLRGGPSGGGTVFTIDAAGPLTIVHAFSGSDGDAPSVGVIRARDGSLYGTTDEDGFNSAFGTVFRIDPAGHFKTIHRFVGSDGFTPTARLIQAGDGRLYGTTNSGGLGQGTIFTITPQGTVTIVHRFTGIDGGHPDGALIEANDGNLYGTTVAGGGHDAGLVYRLDVIAQSVAPTADAYVRGGVWAATNFGRLSTLVVKKGASADNTSRSYLTFDVSGLDASRPVSLRILGHVASAATPALNINVYGVSDTRWDERTVTWNTRPDLGATLATRTITGTQPQWVEIDVTSFVRAQRAAGADAIALALRSLVHTTAGAVFTAKDATVGQPLLVVRR